MGESMWEILDRAKYKMESEVVIHRRRMLASTFVEFTKLSPIVPLTQVGQMESLDSVRAEIRGRVGSRKFRHISFDGISEEYKFEKRGMSPVGVQIYTGIFAGSAEHPEVHEAVAMLSGELIIEKNEARGAEVRKHGGPISYDEACDPSTIYSFGYSYVDGKDVPIVRITTLKSDFYQEFTHLDNGTHRAVKPLDQKEPSVAFIFKYQGGQPYQPNIYRDHPM